MKFNIKFDVKINFFMRIYNDPELFFDELMKERRNNYKIQKLEKGTYDIFEKEELINKYVNGIERSLTDLCVKVLKISNIFKRSLKSELKKIIEYKKEKLNIESKEIFENYDNVKNIMHDINDLEEKIKSIKQEKQFYIEKNNNIDENISKIKARMCNVAMYFSKVYDNWKKKHDSYEELSSINNRLNNKNEILNELLNLNCNIINTNMQKKYLLEKSLSVKKRILLRLNRYNKYLQLPKNDQIKINLTNQKNQINEKIKEILFRQFKISEQIQIFFKENNYQEELKKNNNELFLKKKKNQKENIELINKLYDLKSIINNLINQEEKMNKEISYYKEIKNREFKLENIEIIKVDEEIEELNKELIKYQKRGFKTQNLWD